MLKKRPSEGTRALLSLTWQMRKFRAELVAASFYNLRRQWMNKWKKELKSMHHEKMKIARKKNWVYFVLLGSFFFEITCKAPEIELLGEKQDAKLSTLVPWQYNSIQSWGSTFQSSKRWKLPHPGQWIHTGSLCPLCFVSYCFFLLWLAVDSKMPAYTSCFYFIKPSWHAAPAVNRIESTRSGCQTVYFVQETQFQTWSFVHCSYNTVIS